MQTDANRHCAIGIAAGICLGPAMCEWAGAKRETGVEHQINGIGIWCDVPRRHNPKLLIDADRVEL